MTDASFLATLRTETRDTWDRARDHRFVRELGSGRIDDAVMSRYLVQDHRFLDGFLQLLGAAIASADRMEARLVLGRFAGLVSGEENTYFERAFAALGVSAQTRLDTPDASATQGFAAIMREAADTRSYPCALAVLNVAEGLYLDWASQVPRPLPENFVHAEWVTLHDNPGFRDFVAFLGRELDRVGPSDEARARDLFGRAVALELRFFDESYAGEAA